MVVFRCSMHLKQLQIAMCSQVNLVVVLTDGKEKTRGARLPSNRIVYPV